MLTIDGSSGEGGGKILQTALAALDRHGQAVPHREDPRWTAEAGSSSAASHGRQGRRRDLRRDGSRR
jgi:hypothetical protein